MNTADLSDKTRRRIAHVSTFPPLRCGIASFASDLISALPDFNHVLYPLHYGTPPLPDTFPHADVNSKKSIVKLARAISQSDCDYVSLQHEFGIWGGYNGENIHPFLDNISKPIVSVLHTTFDSEVRNRVQQDIIVRLTDASHKVVVLTKASEATLRRLVGDKINNVVTIPHGIPEFPYIDPPPLWAMRTPDNSRPVRLISPGFFREDKGVEIILQAISILRSRQFNITYRLAGEAQSQFVRQSAYRDRLSDLLTSLNLTSVVHIDDRYLSVNEQAAAIQEAHIGIFGYQDASQASSGTVPLVLSMGRPAICTPFEYARAKAEEGQGVLLAAGFDPDSMVDAIQRLIELDEYPSLAKTTYDRTRPWTWNRIGRTFDEVFRACAK